MLYPKPIPQHYTDVDLLSEGLLTVAQASEFLGGISKSKLYEWMNRGVLPFVAFGTEVAETTKNT